MRTAKLTRETKETRITVEINLDGTGVYDVTTNIGFLDHMLEQFSRHSLMDLKVQAEGDLHIDTHHITEDCGIVIGQALAKALGDKKGIRRYGSRLLPMDEALTRVTLDFSGRPILVWNVHFSQEKLGTIDTELFQEWFRALAQNANLTLHVDCLRGENNHHIAETCYKALAYAVREAIEIDPRSPETVPSTKGML